MKMKIVTYNINGLRPRIAQFGSLRKLLDSLDADIICFQVPLFVLLLGNILFFFSRSFFRDFNFVLFAKETKLSKQELRADLVRAEGYESFFSCNRNFEKSRAGYSGKFSDRNLSLSECVY